MLGINMSTTIFKEVDCNSTAFQTLQIISFTKPMGEGSILRNYNPNKKIKGSFTSL